MQAGSAFYELHNVLRISWFKDTSGILTRSIRGTQQFFEGSWILSVSSSDCFVLDENYLERYFKRRNEEEKVQDEGETTPSNANSGNPLGRSVIRFLKMNQ